MQPSTFEEEKYFLLKNGIVVFDRSNAGKLLVKGNDRIDLLNRLCATELKELTEGNAKTVILTTEKAKMIDLLFLMHKTDETIILTGDRNEKKIIQWLDKFTFTEAISVEDVSNKYNILFISGKEPERLLRKFNIDADNVTSNKFLQAEIKNIPVYIFNDIYGINIMTETDRYCELNKRISEEGREFNLSDISTAVFDAIRIEKGLPAFGKEITEEVNPLELGLEKYISFNKGCYPGQEVIARLDSQNKVGKDLKGIRFDSLQEADLRRSEKAPEIFINDKKIGIVTSVTYSYGLKSFIGLCLIKKNEAISAFILSVKFGDRQVKAHLTQLPFTL
jgi:tRNA-modifying protein YgfZ